MRVKIPRWEIAVICSALLFPGTSLSAQEVGQEEKEVKEMRQDVERHRITQLLFIAKSGEGQAETLIGSAIDAVSTGVGTILERIFQMSGK